VAATRAYFRCTSPPLYTPSTSFTSVTSSSSASSSQKPACPLRILSDRVSRQTPFRTLLCRHSLIFRCFPDSARMIPLEAKLWRCSAERWCPSALVTPSHLALPTSDTRTSARIRRRRDDASAEDPTKRRKIPTRVEVLESLRRDALPQTRLSANIQKLFNRVHCVELTAVASLSVLAPSALNNTTRSTRE